MEERAFSVRAWCEEDKVHGPQQHVSLSRPYHVFYWTRSSICQGGEYSYCDASGLRTMVPEPESLRHANLSEGYPDAFVRKQDPDDAVPLDVLLYGAKVARLSMDRPNVVTFRNNLNKLLMTPQQQNDPWVIDAVWHGTTLFLEIVKVPEQRQNPDHDRFTYYGYKFEALCTGGGAEPSDPVDSTGEFAVMVEVRLGRHLILMAAETDAWEAPPEKLREEFVGYVELKTYVLPQNDRAKERLYREKYARWWVQSFLAGVPTLVAGGRDRSGILQKVERLPVTRLPALAREQGFPFDAFQLLRFGDAALDWMCATASKMPDEQVRFEYDPGRGAITATVLDPEHGYDLLARVVTALAPQQEGEERPQIEEGME